MNGAWFSFSFLYIFSSEVVLMSTQPTSSSPNTGHRAAETLQTSITAFMQQKQNRHENIFMSCFFFFFPCFFRSETGTRLCFSHLRRELVRVLGLFFFVLSLFFVRSKRSGSDWSGSGAADDAGQNRMSLSWRFTLVCVRAGPDDRSRPMGTDQISTLNLQSNANWAKK